MGLPCTPSIRSRIPSAARPACCRSGRQLRVGSGRQAAGVRRRAPLRQAAADRRAGAGFGGGGGGGRGAGMTADHQARGRSLAYKISAWFMQDAGGAAREAGWRRWAAHRSTTARQRRKQGRSRPGPSGGCSAAPRCVGIRGEGRQVQPPPHEAPAAAAVVHARGAPTRPLPASPRLPWRLTAARHLGRAPTAGTPCPTSFARCYAARLRQFGARGRGAWVGRAVLRRSCGKQQLAVLRPAATSPVLASCRWAASQKASPLAPASSRL